MKAGLEIHQQLATGKLFCACRGNLTEEFTGEFVRELKATGGETGEIDAAALAQASRGKTYRYQVTPNTCLVEADEEPPHAINPSAVEVALTLATLLGSRIVPDIPIMRKVVVDGSNTAGFQRTALIAVGGKIDVNGKTYGILTVCLEEDAARKVGETGDQVTYRLDRLGIPLIEIATAPDIRNGKEAREVAEAIGLLLRSTRRVNRGIGTIREDLNISIEGGARVEIKGVQELGAIESYVENEAERQRVLLEVTRHLPPVAERYATAEPVNLTATMSGSGSKVIAGELKRGGVVFGMVLPGLTGWMGKADKNPERLGRELADYARATGVKGILHSDELPGYGITPEEVANVRRALSLTSEGDAFAMVVAPSDGAARRALAAVKARATQIPLGIPEETRDPVQDGRTRYSRPLPGRHRMYPETDLPPFHVTADLLTSVRDHLPESPKATLSRLAAGGLSREVAGTLLREGLVDDFDTLIKEGFPSSVVARLLTQEIPAIERKTARTLLDGHEGMLDTLRELLSALGRGEFAKEALGNILERMTTNSEDLQAALRNSGLAQMSREELETVVTEVMERNHDMIHQKGMGALSPLMGDVMARVRGRIDGQVVSDAVRSSLASRVTKGSSS